MKHKVYFRTDGSSQIGLGHVVRCMALANMLKNDFEIEFYYKEVPDNILAELDETGLNYTKIENDNEFIHQLSKNTIAVLDGYQFDTAFHRQIKATGAKLVCIDDLHDKELVADLVINHAPGVKTGNYKAQPYTQFAIGPEYCLLRPNFLEQSKKKRKIEKIETVMICFGGSDYKNLTERTLRIVKSFNNFIKVIIVTGTSYDYEDSLNLLMNEDKRIVHHHSVDEKKMLSLMLESELAIVPASGILLEVMAAGCITISGMYAENQKLLYFNYKQLGTFIDAMDFNEVDLHKAIEQSFNIEIEKKQIIDGNSGKRLLKLFLQLELKEKIQLRTANTTDVKITYKWASNPLVRAYSFTQHTITEEEHNRWFHSKLVDFTCLYLIAEIDNSIVGSVRFDLKETESIISYLVDPEYQGKGLGQIILIKGIENLLKLEKNNNFNLQKMVGFVMKTNMPSIKAFERLGFTKYEENDKFKFEMSLS